MSKQKQLLKGGFTHFFSFNSVMELSKKEPILLSHLALKIIKSHNLPMLSVPFGRKSYYYMIAFQGR